MMVELLHSRAAAPATLLPERRDNFILHSACLGALAPLDWACKTSSTQKATPALFRLVVAFLPVEQSPGAPAPKNPAQLPCVAHDWALRPAAFFLLPS
ncbi:hypothetical protein A4R29_09065 [Mesorhizobium ciceri biovar biserrulae]|nr:hypothetical protein A4R29_09065 [Mesorhizobium ciceri biovar biserrulae]